MPVGSSCAQLVGQREAELPAADDGVDALGRLEVRGRQGRRGVASNASRRSSTRAASIVKPAAARWPP